MEILLKLFQVFVIGSLKKKVGEKNKMALCLLSNTLQSAEPGKKIFFRGLGQEDKLFFYSP